MKSYSMTVTVPGIKAGFEVQLELYNTQRALRKAADDFSGALAVVGGWTYEKDTAELLGFCTQPIVTYEQSVRAVIQSRICISLEGYKESTVWHEFYHFVYFVNTLFDSLNYHDSDNLLMNHERCATIMGSLGPAIRAQLLPIISKETKDYERRKKERLSRKA